MRFLPPSACRTYVVSPLRLKPTSLSARTRGPLREPSRAATCTAAIHVTATIFDGDGDEEWEAYSRLAVSLGLCTSRYTGVPLDYELIPSQANYMLASQALRSAILGILAPQDTAHRVTSCALHVTLRLSSQLPDLGAGDAFAPPQVRLQRGFSHCPGVHLGQSCARP